MTEVDYDYKGPEYEVWLFVDGQQVGGNGPFDSYDSAVIWAKACVLTGRCEEAEVRCFHTLGGPTIECIIRPR